MKKLRDILNENDLEKQATEGAAKHGMKHYIINRNGQRTVLNHGQLKQLKIKKEHIEKTFHPPKQQQSSETDLQSIIANQYFKDVKKRGF